jgi:hypothetical protein
MVERQVRDSMDSRAKSNLPPKLVSVSMLGTTVGPTGDPTIAVIKNLGRPSVRLLHLIIVVTASFLSPMVVCVTRSSARLGSLE